MTVTTTTHLNFRGQAREALEFWASIFGGEVQAFTFGDAHVETEDAVADQLIWGGFRSPNGLSPMAFDVPPARAYDPGVEPVYVAVQSDDADELTHCFEALSEGGSVRTPLGPSGFSPVYGMVQDRFGIWWVLSLTTQ